VGSPLNAQPPARRLEVLLVSGSTRAGSTNTAVLRTLQTAMPAGTFATLYGGLAALPAFNPDDDQPPSHPEVVALRAAVGRVDAVLVCTPEYAGDLPGSFKNLLDWTVGGGEMNGKPVAWINAGRDATETHVALRRVLGYLGAEIVDDACARLPVARDAVGPDGLVQDVRVRAEIIRLGERLVAYVRDRGDR
jgi:NAD(P)H-dependent FMN reductase